MHNLDPPELVPINPKSGVFHTYGSKVNIIDHFMTGKIISGYLHPQYPKHVIVAFQQADKMLELVALQ